MIIAGFDPPSVRNLGFAILSTDESKKTIRLKEAGIIKLKEKYSDEIRDYDFGVKSRKLENFLEDFYLERSIDKIVLEQQVLSKKGSRYFPPFLIAQTQIMACTLEKMAYIKGISREQIHVKTLKKEVAGHGNASKQDMMDEVICRLGLEIFYGDNTPKQHIKKYEHVYDAIALGLSGVDLEDYEVLDYGKFVPKIIPID